MLRVSMISTQDRALHGGDHSQIHNPYKYMGNFSLMLVKLVILEFGTDVVTTPRVLVSFPLLIWNPIDW